MDEFIRKAIMCYEQAKAKVQQGKRCQTKKEQKGSFRFKRKKTSNFKGIVRSLVSKQFGKNHQRVRWPADDKPTEAYSKPEQTQNPPLQCWGCGETHYY